MSAYTLRERFGLASWYLFDAIRTRALKLTDPKAWNPALWNLYGQSQTQAGVSINQNNALNLSSVYAAVNVIAGTISTLPIHLYKKKPDGKRKLITGHASLMVLTSRANEYLPSMNYREAAMGHILAYGNQYAEIVRKDTGEIKELWLLTPDRVTPKVLNGRFVYVVDVNGEDRTFERADILHIAGLGFDGMIGYSVISKAAESIGLSVAAEHFGARYFGANTNLGGVIKHPRQLGPEAKKNLKDSLAGYSGSSNSHRWMILEEGLEVEKIGFSPDDSQFLQTRQFQVSEVARWFNLPPHKLKDLTRSTFSNIEEQEIEFVTGCIRPWIERLEQNYNLQLLTEKERKLGYYFKHSVEGLLRGASAARADYYTKLFYLGSITPNEIRELEDRDAIDEENADKTYLQMNLMPLSEADEMSAMNSPGGAGGLAPQPPEEPPEEPEVNALQWARESVKLIEYRNIGARDRISKRYYPLIADSVSVVVYRERLIMEKVLKQTKSMRSSAAVKEKIAEAYSGFSSYVDKKMAPVFSAFAESIYYSSLFEIGESVDAVPADVLDEISRYSTTYAKRHASSSQGQISSLVDDNPETYTEEIENRLEEWREKRPDKVAANETVRLSNFMAQTSFFSFGYKSYWRIRGAKTCAYCQTLSGRSIKDGQSFFSGGEEFEPKGTPAPMLIRSTVKHPPLHRGCDCYISAR